MSTNFSDMWSVYDERINYLKVQVDALTHEIMRYEKKIEKNNFDLNNEKELNRQYVEKICALRDENNELKAQLNKKKRK